MSTGRGPYLKRLKDYFSSSDKKRKSFLLHGMPGIGKTQICLKFIENCATLWVLFAMWPDKKNELLLDSLKYFGLMHLQRTGWRSASGRVFN